MDFIRLLDSRQAERLRGLHSGRPCLVLCRSPWLEKDLAGTPELYGLAVRIGVNFTILGHRLDYCLGGDPAFWERVDPGDWPHVFFLTGMNPGPPKNGHGNLTDFQVTRRFSTVNSLCALWLAHYMECEPIRICGAHFAGDPETGEFYGDVPLETLYPDPADRQRYLNQYQGRLPWLARDFRTIVGEMRAAGVKVDWPGEEMARTVDNLGNAHPQEQLLLAPTVEKIARGYAQAQGVEV